MIKFEKGMFFLFCVFLCMPMPTVCHPSNGTRELIECAKIVGGSTAAACIYGVSMDMVTARVCPEYFTKGFHKRMSDRHPDGFIKRQMQSDSPTKLALSWGVLASWWMGLGLSIPLLAAARIGSWPQISMQDLIKPCAVALSGMGIYGAIEGIRGYREAEKKRAKNGFLNAFDYGAGWDTPDEALSRFIADSHAHRAAYASGACAGLGLCAWTIGKRYAMSKAGQ